MIARRTLGTLVIAACLTVAAQGAVAPSALGHGLDRPTAATALTRQVDAALGARRPLAPPERGEPGRFVLDGPRGTRCYPRGC
jgi:hypothetical protein